MRKNSLALALIRSELCRAYASAAARQPKPGEAALRPAARISLSGWLAARRRHDRKRARR